MRYIIVDGNYCCHRIYHAFGNALAFKDEPTAVIFGFLRDVGIWMEEFSTDRVVFAFDFGRGKRREICPTYKTTREKAHEDDSEEEKESTQAFQRQVRKLRESYLVKLGYRNVFFQEGYEADDIIASVAKYSLAEDDEAIIISSDQDLWQLISPSVSCYNPHQKRMIDLQAFRRQWGIEPALWANVKAIAGCTTDDVVGLRGVGEATAVKWFQSKLKPESVAYKKINSEGIDIHNRNIKLVLLPFEGCERFKLQKDDVTTERWQALTDKLGMRSLRELMPGQPAGVRKGVERKPRSSVGFGF